MSPTAAWLAAASKPDAAPILVFQMPDLGSGLFFATEPGHYPVMDPTPERLALQEGGFLKLQDGTDLLIKGISGSPHHAALVAEGGRPTITRRVQNIFSGRSTTAIGDIRLVDDGLLDEFFGGYESTLRGARITGYVHFAGLDFATDAEKYFVARVEQASVSDAGEISLRLIDEQTFLFQKIRIAEGTYTAQKLGDVVKARLTAAGVAYPGDYDATAWAAWTAAGQPGDYTVTGSWNEGDVFTVLDGILGDSFSWYCFRRDGKFYIEKFADLGATPPVTVSLEDAASCFEGGSAEMFLGVFRQQTVKYNGGAASVSRTVNLSTAHPWWPTAAEGQAVDIGLTGLADATALADARLAVLSSEHLVSTLHADLRMLAFNLGDTVEVTLSGKKLPGSVQKYHRVTEIKEDPNSGKTIINLWSKLGGPPLP